MRNLAPVSRRKAVSHVCKTASLGICLWFSAACPLFSQGFTTADLYRLRAVSEVSLARDGSHVAYTVVKYDRPERPYPQVWVMDLATRKTTRVGGEEVISSAPLWSPDGHWLAYLSSAGGEQALWVARADASGAVRLGRAPGSNSPLPGQGDSITWSPDSRQIAYLGATPGSHTAEFAGDPMIITRYLYRPTMTEGLTRFTDNRHLHIFVADLTTRQVRQLTHGDTDEHSIDWSPDGKEILFVSNHELNADEFLNYDIFAVKVAGGSIRRITATESCEYGPRWSSDGKSILYSANLRGLTNQETTSGVVVAASRIWVLDANGKNRRDVGGVLDQREGLGQWAPEGNAIYFPAERRGNLHLMRITVPAAISSPEPDRIVGERGTVAGWSIAKGGLLACALTTPYDLGQLYLQKGNARPEKLTDLNQDVLAGKKIAEVKSFTFNSNDNKYEVEAYLTVPPGVPQDIPDMADAPKHPMIISLHGGPHAQSGPAFVPKNQIYASHGWAVLQVNYRGSAGYGQAFMDAVIGDQNGNEAQDVLYGVSAAVRRYLWIDRERLGLEGTSYGGQLTMWLITQTNEFKAAIPMRGVANLISQNYVTYANQFEAMLWGKFLHQDNYMDVLWERSALKHVANVHTPALILHGENDSDVPIEESEQFFIALKDVGVPTVFVRYPREGHGLDETRHLVDSIDRSIAWYEKYFPHQGHEGITNVQP
jgi:dipeptidyl aminopeptidase/acylaminoacyl peptidase